MYSFFHSARETVSAPRAAVVITDESPIIAVPVKTTNWRRLNAKDIAYPKKLRLTG